MRVCGLWRRVRLVKLVLVPDEKKYVVQCSCCSSEATCLPCVHQMNVIEDPFHALQLRNFDWHPRVTTAYYYSAVVSGSARDVHLAASRQSTERETSPSIQRHLCGSNAPSNPRSITAKQSQVEGILHLPKRISCRSEPNAARGARTRSISTRKR